MEPTANDPVDPSQWNEDTMAGEPLAELPAVVELLRRRCGVGWLTGGLADTKGSLTRG